MKVSDLIRQLTEIEQRFGDLQVVVGEASGVFQDRLGVNVDDVKGDRVPVAIVQAYVIRSK